LGVIEKTEKYHPTHREQIKDDCSVVTYLSLKTVRTLGRASMGLKLKFVEGEIIRRGSDLP